MYPPRTLEVHRIRGDLKAILPHLMPHETEEVRRDYQPQEIRCLLVGESPPAGGTFFYRADSLLYEATREAFLRAVPDLGQDDDFLRSFKRLGCYLDDLCSEPVNRLPKPERKLARRQGIRPLARRLRDAQPRAIVVVMKGIVPEVTEARQHAGLKDVPLYGDLPFPTTRYPNRRERYVRTLAGLVREFKAQGLLTP
jgi:hypothetical protein